MDKLVKITNSGHLSVYNCNGPIGPIRLNSDDIMKGLLFGYNVVELLGTKEVKLDFMNYNKDNHPKQEVKVEVPEILTQKIVNSGTDNRRNKKKKIKSNVNLYKEV